MSAPFIFESHAPSPFASPHGSPFIPPSPLMPMGTPSPMMHASALPGVGGQQQGGGFAGGGIGGQGGFAGPNQQQQGFGGQQGQQQGFGGAFASPHTQQQQQQQFPGAQQQFPGAQHPFPPQPQPQSGFVVGAQQQQQQQQQQQHIFPGQTIFPSSPTPPQVEFDPVMGCWRPVRTQSTHGGHSGNSGHGHTRRPSWNGSVSASHSISSSPHLGSTATLSPNAGSGAGLGLGLGGSSSNFAGGIGASPSSTSTSTFNTSGTPTRPRRQSFGGIGGLNLDLPSAIIPPPTPDVAYHPYLDGRQPRQDFWFDVSMGEFRPMVLVFVQQPGPPSSSSFNALGMGAAPQHVQVQVPLSAEQLAAPATHPPLPRLRISFPSLPSFVVDVVSSNSGSSFPSSTSTSGFASPHSPVNGTWAGSPAGLTVGDVLREIYRRAQHQIEQDDFDALGDEMRRRVSKAYSQRCHALGVADQDEGCVVFFFLRFSVLHCPLLRSLHSVLSILLFFRWQSPVSSLHPPFSILWVFDSTLMPMLK
ncbi:hypothetical protein CYLTODRAFT_421230 [Cylindrobasidium torrendii FP15055 ss-10]|uniref:DUF6699 domain-containing protein n=1 Tax=Cylindrobasidium torrendii FP15055 ss-10 TaxID=1314674 RepID=A0A0D7BEH5_9AGAR|nr:hypothetical protein CYLTODRAFT_421230 [Cylindrobasidium torrendii FP15055 ss-10]